MSIEVTLAQSCGGIKFLFPLCKGIYYISIKQTVHGPYDFVNQLAAA